MTTQFITFLEHFGRYFMMLQKTFSSFTKSNVLAELTFKEINTLILSSLGLIAFISFFMGGVVAIQTAINTQNPLIPKYIVGFTTRQSIILEFSPTFVSIILAGKIGSFITSSIGSMRVTEQIDALEIMGVNSHNYLILPKIIAISLLPIIINISMFLGIFGGYFVTQYGGFSSHVDFVEGLQLDFVPFQLIYAYIKTFVFAILLVTIPAYHGYYMKGGALEVGNASTRAFIWTSISIIIANLVITNLLLT